MVVAVFVRKMYVIIKASKAAKYIALELEVSSPSCTFPLIPSHRGTITSRLRTTSMYRHPAYCRTVAEPTMKSLYRCQWLKSRRSTSALICISTQCNSLLVTLSLAWAALGGSGGGQLPPVPSYLPPADPHLSNNNFRCPTGVFIFL